MRALSARSGLAPETAGGPATFTGTLALLRFMLRRDRFRSTAWVAGIGLLGFYFAYAIQVIAEDEAELAQLAILFNDSVGRLMTGPAFGMDAPTFERFFSAAAPSGWVPIWWWSWRVRHCCFCWWASAWAWAQLQCWKWMQAVILSTALPPVPSSCQR